MTTIILALAAANILFALLARGKGHSLRAVGGMWLDGAKQALTVIRVLLLIGAVTGIWRAAGTIAASVDYGVRFITPHLFLPVVFLLTSLLSYALGTSFGVAGTAGVIFMTLARSGGIDPSLTAGVLFSAIMVGDRGSPVASSAVTVAQLTKTDLFGNVRRMMRTGAIPFALCCLVYGLLAVRHPIHAIDPAVLESLRSEFQLSPWVFAPAALMLLLPLFRVPIVWCMGLSILSGGLVAHFAQGMDWLSLLRCCVLGYTARSAGLVSILNGGGIVSMAESCIIVLLACACSGIFHGTDMLAGLERRVEALTGRIGTFPALMLLCLLSAAVFCNQLIAIVMSRQLFGPIYERQGRSREELALDIENTAITLPAFIPWCILSSVPLRLMGVGYGSLRYAVFLYAVPLVNLFFFLLREHKARQHR